MQVARFVRFCDSFSFPLLILLDPSPGHDSSHDSSAPPPRSEDLRGAAQLMFAVVEASVRKLALLLSPAATASLINAQVGSQSAVHYLHASVLRVCGSGGFSAQLALLLSPAAIANLTNAQMRLAIHG